LTDPSYKGNGEGEGEMPVFRIFQFDEDHWVEIDPVTGEKEEIDIQDIMDDLDIGEEEGEN
jgi:hypothetical protein